MESMNVESDNPKITLENIQFMVNSLDTKIGQYTKLCCKNKKTPYLRSAHSTLKKQINLDLIAIFKVCSLNYPQLLLQHRSRIEVLFQHDFIDERVKQRCIEVLAELQLMAFENLLNTKPKPFVPLLPIKGNCPEYQYGVHQQKNTMAISLRDNIITNPTPPQDAQGKLRLRS